MNTSTMDISKFIQWDVDRILLPIYGPIAIRWYSLLFLAGFLIGFYAFTSMVKKEGKDPTAYTDSLLFHLIKGVFSNISTLVPSPSIIALTNLAGFINIPPFVYNAIL